MTFLPIVERELRVTARRRATYWSRLLMAFIAMTVGFGVLLANLGAAEAVVGGYFFTGLAVFALIYCLLSGRRSTADCLSEEKREGTLGLLFLTDLTGYDVVLGKLVATSLNAFYGLLAVFPILAIPLMMGGITYGEFWRLVLVLLDTFLFSLAIGMYASAKSRDLRKTMAVNFALLIAFVLVIPALAAVVELQWSISVPVLLFPSPIFCFTLIYDAHYKAQPQYFWWSLAFIHWLTWLFLIQASRLAPQSWQDLPAAKPRANKIPRQGFWQFWNYGKTHRLPAYRKKLLDQNAFYWLAARARLKPFHVWTFLILIGGWCIVVHTLAGGVLDDLVNIIIALLLNTTIKLWLTLEAGHRLAEDRKIGALELILSTPLGERDIVRGQMLALRRQFLLPAIAVIVLDLFLLKSALDFSPHQGPRLMFLWLASVGMFIADLIALSWVAMARALTSKNYNFSVAATVFCVLLLPWLVFGSATFVMQLWYELTTPNGVPFGAAIHPGWFIALSLLADVYFARQARRQLFDHMRYLAAQRFSSPSTPAVIEPRRREKPSRKQILRWAFAIFLFFAGVAFFWPASSPKFPPPILVPVSLSQGSVRVMPGSTGALVLLPDGSLWRLGRVGGIPQNIPSPERFDTNHWLQAATSPDSLMAIRDDGTLWTQSPRFGLANELTLMDASNDWVAVSTAGLHGSAVRRDGTLWAWGNNQLGQLGNGQGPNQTNLVQVGTNDGWAKVFCTGGATLAIRQDGTLWAWGRTFFYGNPTGGSVPNTLTLPTQLCRETNWTEFATAGPAVKIRNRQGELWEPFFTAPNAELGAAVTCRLAGSNSAPDHLAFAYCGQPTAFEIHPDGTLWQCPYALSSTILSPATPWQRVGNRSDWTSLWGGDGAAFGLTAEGTLWTWGFDYTRQIPADFNSKLRLLQVRIMSAFGSAPATMRSAGMGRNALWQYQKEPHPILRLTSTR